MGQVTVALLQLSEQNRFQAQFTSTKRLVHCSEGMGLNAMALSTGARGSGWIPGTRYPCDVRVILATVLSIAHMRGKIKVYLLGSSLRHYHGMV
jgi:hypothetical protein